MTIQTLLHLPRTIRKGDFVHALSKGIAEPDETIATYAITPRCQDSCRLC